MPKTEVVSLQVAVAQNIEVTKWITKVTILADQRVYWTAKWIHNEEEVKTCHYSCPYSELAQGETGGGTFEEEIENALFLKSAAIDAMPEGTAEEKAAKAERFGITP